uniref:Uncharacterized protein n=1 Tax=Steinernema glaseri TaxID=37863 RepID=A0A1I7ZMY8_9BILA
MWIRHARLLLEHVVQHLEVLRSFHSFLLFFSFSLSDQVVDEETSNGRSFCAVPPPEYEREEDEVDGHEVAHRYGLHALQQRGLGQRPRRHDDAGGEVDDEVEKGQREGERCGADVFEDLKGDGYSPSRSLQLNDLLIRSPTRS